MEYLSIRERIVSGICRLCLSNDGALIDMFSFSSELESQIAVAVTKCTSVKIEKHVKLPTTTCESCYMQLIKTQKFQRQTLQSDNTLQLYLKQLEDDKQTLLGSSVTLPDISGNRLIETKVAENDKEDNSTNFEEIKPQVNYLESGCEEFEMDIVEHKVVPLETKTNSDCDVYKSDKDSTFNPNLIVKTEPIINDFERIDIDTAVLNDFLPSQKIIKSESEVIASNQCDVCKNCFSNSDLLREHQRIHADEKRYQCDVCNKSFNKKFVLRMHERIHTGEKPHQCDVCNKSFRQLGILTTHRRLHTGEKPYKCDVCNKSFSHLGSLTKHGHVHTGEKPYKCDICKKDFATNVALGKHRRLHTGEKPYQCDVCNMIFSRSENLKLHQRIHTGEKPYQCDVCNKCFSQPSTLVRHQRLHTGEKPYQCDVCNKRFTINGALIIHRRVHTGEKPYQCDVCSKCFTTNGALRSHNRGHTGEKPYQCDVCKKCFTRLNSLNKHVSRHTSDV